jgi:hypothetical protein
MKIVREHIEFERGLEPRDAMKIGLGETEKEIYQALKDLKDLGINVSRVENPYNKEIIDLEIPELDGYQVSYLPKEERYWTGPRSIPGLADNPWGWGIYELEDGDMIIESKPWKETLEKIKKLLHLS